MRFLLLFFTVLLVSASSAVAASYDYISPEALKNALDNGQKMLVVDIQVEDEFNTHHITGSIPTYAYPAKSKSDIAKLDMVIEKQQKTGEDVVIVCPRGAGGAKRSYDYLKERGIAEDKLLILEKGMDGWPYPELTVVQ